MKTNAVRDGDDWILNGSKTFISNGTLANLGLIAARTKKEGKAAHAISLFLVDTREHKGFNKGKNLRYNFLVNIYVLTDQLIVHSKIQKMAEQSDAKSAKRSLAT